MRQISLILENRLGIVAELTELLARQAINIETIDAELAGRHVVVVLTVDDFDKANRIVRNFGALQVLSEQALLVKLKDEPGALAKIARRFFDAGIGMHSIRIIQREHDYSLVAISADQLHAARELVGDVLIR